MSEHYSVEHCLQLILKRALVELTAKKGWRRVVQRLISSIGSVATNLQVYVFFKYFTIFQMLRTIFLASFEKKIIGYARESIDDTDIMKNITIAFKLELSELEADMFDHDNVLLIDMLKTTFTTFEHVEILPEEQQRKQTELIAEWLNQASTQASNDLDGEFSVILKESIEFLEENSIEEFEEFIEGRIKAVHGAVLGWQ